MPWLRLWKVYIYTDLAVGEVGGESVARIRAQKFGVKFLRIKGI